MPNEFELIERYFAKRPSRGDVIVAVGDDGAVVEPQSRAQLVISTDTLVEGIHFPKGAPPRSIGHKVLAVNLSDLAAMGAEPAWATLVLTLPEPGEQWLSDFAKGFQSLASRYAIDLIGGGLVSFDRKINRSKRSIILKGVHGAIQLFEPSGQKCKKD